MLSKARLAGAAIAAMIAAAAAPAAAAPGDPETTITSAPGEPVVDGRATFAFAADELGAGFECRVDEQEWSPCTSPHTTAPQQQGDHVFQVRAVDLEGNRDPTPAEAPFVVDKSIAGANAAARRVIRLGGGPIRIRIRVTAAEPATASAFGAIATGGRRVRLPASEPVAIPAGQERTIAVGTSGRDARRVRRALRKDGAAATLRVTFTDALGNTATTGVIEVELKRRR